MDHLLRGKFYHSDLLIFDLPNGKEDALRKRKNLYL